MILLHMQYFSVYTIRPFYELGISPSSLFSETHDFYSRCLYLLIDIALILHVYSR